MNRLSLAHTGLRIAYIVWNIFIVWYATIRLSVLLPEAEVLSVYIFIPALLANILQFALYTKLPTDARSFVRIAILPIVWVACSAVVERTPISDVIIQVGVIALVAAAVNLGIAIFGLIISGFRDKTGNPLIRKRRYMIVYLPVYLIICGLALFGTSYVYWQWFRFDSFVSFGLITLGCVHQCIAYYRIVRTMWA